MPAQALLVAGACHLDDLPQQDPGLIGGAGAYAAIAAAALTPCQLWARCGEDFSTQCQRILEQRRIDISGLITEGTTNRFDGNAMTFNGPVLPEVSPHDAKDLGATLCIDLPFAEAKRAWDDLGRLKHADKRIRIQAPGRQCSSREELAAWAKQADLLVVDYQRTSSLCAEQDPMVLLQQLQDMGCESIVLCNDHFGGLIKYKQKTTGFLADPRSNKEPVGVHSSFVGVLSGGLCSAGKLDFRSLKRSTATAGAVAGVCSQGGGPKKLLGLRREDYHQLFYKLRRTSKF
jgi:hypothetical protein